MKILLVDDDNDILANNAEYLAKKGYDICLAHDGAEALEKAPGIDVIVLDVGLPDTDGFILAPKLAQITNAPILFLTAWDTDEAMENGFSLGSDYMKKPYSLKELSLRIEAVFKSRVNIDTGVLELPPLIINTHSLTVTIFSHSVAFTPYEFKILTYFAKSINQTLSYQKIYRAIWGDNGFDVSMVAQHVAAIRKKLKDNCSPDFIKTIRGIGYLFQYPPDKTHNKRGAADV